MTTEILDDPAMGTYSYKERLSMSPVDAAILKHRFAGLSDLGVAGILSNSFSGTQVLPPSGIKKLQGSDNSRWSNPDSRMKRHRHQSKTTVLHTDRLKCSPSPGDVLSTDTYYSGLPKPLAPFFQVFVDKMVPVGWVYPMMRKSELL